MEDSYFVLRADKPLGKDQPWFTVGGLKDAMLQGMARLQPTPASMEAGHLEWLIPNNIWNQNWISIHYKHMTVLQQGEEQSFKMAGMPEPKKEKKISSSKKVSPVMRKKLKSELKEKLTAKGVDVPEGTTLENMQELAALA